MMDTVELYDAHVHLQQKPLESCSESLLRGNHYRFGGCVCNGTHEGDWESVIRLAGQDARILPAFGLHPWKVKERSDHWLQQLETLLRRYPNASVGEVGLDKWVQDHDIGLQRELLIAQMDLAVRYDRAVTLHCLRAWGPLLDVLRDIPLPSRGFLLHAYGGPREMLKPLLRLGARFSFNATTADPRKEKHWQTFREIPADRLLVETDAPDMIPPADFRPAQQGEAEVEFNHPGNLPAAYAFLAKLREVTPDELAEQVKQNYRELFQ
jgi:TatD DNase family protein